MHRAAPASRAFGRYAVGLPADPGHRRLTRRAQTTADNGQTTTNTTTTTGLDRPRSFRNDNKEGSIWRTRCRPAEWALWARIDRSRAPEDQKTVTDTGEVAVADVCKGYESQGKAKN